MKTNWKFIKNLHKHGFNLWKRYKNIDYDTISSFHNGVNIENSHKRQSNPRLSHINRYTVSSIVNGLHGTLHIIAIFVESIKTDMLVCKTVAENANIYLLSANQSSFAFYNQFFSCPISHEPDASLMNLKELCI